MECYESVFNEEKLRKFKDELEQVKATLLLAKQAEIG